MGADHGRLRNSQPGGSDAPFLERGHLHLRCRSGTCGDARIHDGRKLPDTGRGHALRTVLVVKSGQRHQRRARGVHRSVLHRTHGGARQ